MYLMSDVSYLKKEPRKSDVMEDVPASIPPDDDI